MNLKELEILLEGVSRGSVSPREAAHALRSGPLHESEIGIAHLDHHRSLRQVVGEVVFGEGKSVEQIDTILRSLTGSGTQSALVTRLDERKQGMLRERFPGARLNPLAGTLLVNPRPSRELSAEEAGQASVRGECYVAIVAAGTSDLRVAEEAAEVCVAAEVSHRKVYDVGVAGLHRLLSRRNEWQGASAFVAVAGMEGALASVLGGLVRRPIFAVPTSVGYGASFGGVAALLAMLNSCAPGVSVMNIDNGFGAGFAAVTVIRAIEELGQAR